MNPKFIILTAIAAIASFAIVLLAMGRFPAITKYASFEMPTLDPTVYNYSKKQAQNVLTKARTTLPRRDGSGQIEIWSNGRSAKGVSLNMQYAKWAPLLSCEAVVTAVAANKSRIVADCGRPTTDSAIESTTEQLHGPMFEEHIRATLTKRAFDRSTVDAREALVVFKNLGGMQREALQRAHEAAREAQ